MRKILFVHHAAAWGGAPKCMISLIKKLDKSKYESKVLLFKYSEVADKLIENGIKYSIADSIFYRKYYSFFPHSEAGYVKWYNIYSFIRLGILWALSRYFFAKKELAKHEFDIVHLNSSVLTDWLAPSKKRGKVIIHIREPFRKGKLDLLHHLFKSQIRKYADNIIAISEDNARRIDVPFKTEVIYDFCEVPDKLPPVESYASKKILYLGGSSTSKGFYTLVKSLDYIDKDVKVLFGGKCEITKKPENLLGILRFILSNARKRNAAIQKIQSHSNAINLGLIYNIYDYLAEVTCLVSPFTVPHFSFPVVEAHMNKKPVIGSDVEGMDEIIKHKRNGLIVPKNNPIALASAINELAKDKQKAKELGEEGYKITVMRFTSQNVLQFERIYDKL